MPRARREFPLLATAAPVFVALAMWGLTGSAFALVFAVLGPVIALAGLIDDKRGRRSSARGERARFASELLTAQDLINKEHARERSRLESLTMNPADILAGQGRNSAWWRADAESPILVCLGRATVPSALELDGAGPLPAGSEPADEIARLYRAAGELTDAPVLVDARKGIVVLGSPVPAAAALRSIIAQLAFTLSPACARVEAADSDLLGWLVGLPHRQEPVRLAASRVVFHLAASDGRRPLEIVCAIARDESELPRDCQAVLRVAPADDLRPLFLSKAEAIAVVAKAKKSAEMEGLVPVESSLPTLLRLSELAAASPSGRLPAVFAFGVGGALTIDLVADGPHAIIGGTTGSGKSELLISWVLAMAAVVGPRQLNFLLVDFKGGSAFGGLRQLPHSVGLLTDLDHGSAGRALSSLRAELQHRERVLAAAGARSIEELTPALLPRLVIVVDEFAVVVAEFPELQKLFADIAARGRSLGVHLILCTQRPAEVVRDSVLANCTLRISLRVNNRADSTAVIGIGDAGDLPKHPFGRGYISVSGSAPEPVQIALADNDDVLAVGCAWASELVVLRKPWHEPLSELVLPSMLPESDGSSSGLPFGLIDLPEEQSQPVAFYDPERRGNLVVLGGHRAGKSGVLAALNDSALNYSAASTSASTRSDKNDVRASLAEYRVAVVPNDIEAAWDCIADALAALSEPRHSELSELEPRVQTVYLLDDLDALLARFSDDHQLVFVERLSQLLREGPARGVRMVMTMARITSASQALLALCDSRLVLRMPNRQEHLLAGGDGQDFLSELPPGGGFWQGHRLQVAFVSSQSPPLISGAGAARTVFDCAAGCLVVTIRVRAVVDRLRAEHTEPGTVIELGAQQAEPRALAVAAGSIAPIMVADPASWQSQWALLAAARGKLPILFDRCSISDFRAVSGSRQLPPPLGTKPGGAWLLALDGTVGRVQLPDWLH